jgi:hypothetical protein
VRLFDFPAAPARAAFEAQGYVHLPGAVTPEFLAHARELIAATLAATPETVGGNAANKVQFRLDFADLPGVQEEVFATFGPLAGKDPRDLTLSERHVNMYRDHADPDPVPHKDRRASQVTIGLAIDIADGSHLVLWPETDRAENLCESAAEHYAGLAPDAKPEQVLRGAPEVAVFDAPGDVVVFHGSRTWHCRRSSAGTTNLFFKLNDFGDDPLGEDARAQVGVAGG